MPDFDKVHCNFLTFSFMCLTVVLSVHDLLDSLGHIKNRLVNGFESMKSNRNYSQLACHCFCSCIILPLVYLLPSFGKSILLQARAYFVSIIFTKSFFTSCQRRGSLIC